MFDLDSPLDGVYGVGILHWEQSEHWWLHSYDAAHMVFVVWSGVCSGYTCLVRSSRWSNDICRRDCIVARRTNIYLCCVNAIIALQWIFLDRYVFVIRIVIEGMERALGETK